VLDGQHGRPVQLLELLQVLRRIVLAQERHHRLACT
jgi:hypothetical protein